MSWKGIFLKDRTYATVRAEIKDCGGGMPFTDVIAVHLDDIRECLKAYPVTISSAKGGRETFVHGCPRKPASIHLASVRAPQDDAGNPAPWELVIVDWDDTTLTVDCTKGVSAQLVARLDSKFQ
jgi:hypothetical protein